MDSSTTENVSTGLLSSLTSTTAEEPKKLCPIYDLWNEAYEELKDQPNSPVHDYEKIAGSQLSIILDSTISLSGIKVDRQKQMATLLQKKVEEVKKNTWKLKFCGESIPLKDLAKPVVGIIKYVLISLLRISSSLRPWKERSMKNGFWRSILLR